MSIVEKKNSILFCYYLLIFIYKNYILLKVLYTTKLFYTNCLNLYLLAYFVYNTT